MRTIEIRCTESESESELARCTGSGPIKTSPPNVDRGCVFGISVLLPKIIITRLICFHFVVWIIFGDFGVLGTHIAHMCDDKLYSDRSDQHGVPTYRVPIPIPNAAIYLTIVMSDNYFERLIKSKTVHSNLCLILLSLVVLFMFQLHINFFNTIRNVITHLKLTLYFVHNLFNFVYKLYRYKYITINMSVTWVFSVVQAIKKIIWSSVIKIGLPLYSTSILVKFGEITYSKEYIVDQNGTLQYCRCFCH